jgi:hypothetical protein
MWDDGMVTEKTAVVQRAGRELFKGLRIRKEP